MKNAFVLVIVAMSTLAGCASQLLTEDRLLSNTADALFVKTSELTITERHEKVPNTFYVATINKTGRQYNCIVNGGSVLTMGITNPPMCNPK
jgi:hypothetical protein